MAILTEMAKGDTISVRGALCTVLFVPEHGDYVIVTNDRGFAFHAFPEMIEDDDGG